MGKTAKLWVKLLDKVTPAVMSRVVTTTAFVILAVYLFVTSLSSTASAASLSETPDELFQVTLASDLQERTALALPEGRNVDAAFLDVQYDPLVPISQPAQVFVAFLDEGAGYRNALGYFTFEAGALSDLTKGDIDTDASGVVSLAELNAIDTVESGFVFPNASKLGAGGLLSPGDATLAGGGAIFDPGTVLGFFLAQNAWTGSKVRLKQGSAETQMFYSADFLNPESTADAELDSASATRHVAMLFMDERQEALLMGFEDLNRVDRTVNAFGYQSDEDFNDAVFLVYSNPVEAIQSSNVATVPSPVPLSASFGYLIVAAAFLMFAQKGRVYALGVHLC